MRKKTRIVVVGLGGIGSALVRPLCQYLCYNRGLDEIEICLVDGDTYATHNVERQFAGVGQKTSVVAAELKPKFSRIRFSTVDQYIVYDTAAKTIFEGNIVLLAVDNHVTRKIVSEHCSDLKDVVIISGGNTDNSGHVMVYHRANGEDLTNPFTSDLHPEIANPTDLHPVEQEAADGCDVLARYEPQFLVVNNLVAAEMLLLLSQYLDNRDMPDEVFLDISGNAMRATYWSLIQRRK